ncbi:NUDIX domain-containing protein [Salinibacterium sp. NSLL150]|uniref:NUDIX hydrolase n=1 Tax=unclassified Salinibacterium TaxID=2632331 RepID=UPI0018CE17C3|nr:MULTISPECIES: NUDIX domain-containing protein [unclassified Salinibacterium]MBH0098050.1 NUDIX domain-containing protein [Salinibacterium sp. NSLL35]MBH0100805.1 NUDIX domain-containing protein [Salinibacterium sp. NSLL150]MBH0103564.1 NUDIX domain-containing protein [Salinibacterium sp. NSLL16]MBH0106325.1 NUDIX domain-containing protein [Salinibacterium sp. NSLL17]
MIAHDLLTQLAALPSSNTRDSFLSFASAGNRSALKRDGGPEHVTASCFVFSPDFERVLLCFHRKGQFWVQFGGHIEPQDASIADAALREAREESGIARLSLLSDSIVDLDRHELHGGFACAAHWDVGFVALAAADVDFAASDESEDVRWFATNALPAEVPTNFPGRLAAVLKAVAPR